MTTITYCDRCKDMTEAEISPPRMLAHRIITQTKGTIKIPDNLDLCDPCAKSLIQMIFAWWDTTVSK